MGPEGTMERRLQKAHGLLFLSQGQEAESKEKLLREAWEGAREGRAELSGMSKALTESVRFLSLRREKESGNQVKGHEFSYDYSSQLADDR